MSAGSAVLRLAELALGAVALRPAELKLAEELRLVLKLAVGL
jgi:hypothetical protein